MKTAAVLEFKPLSKSKALASRPATLPTLHASVAWGRLGSVDRLSAALVLVPSPQLDDFALLLSSSNKTLVVYLDLGAPEVLATVRRWMESNFIELCVHDGPEPSHGKIRLHIDHAAEIGLERWEQHSTRLARPTRLWPDNAQELAETLANTASLDWCGLTVV